MAIAHNFIFELEIELINMDKSKLILTLQSLFAVEQNIEFSLLYGSAAGPKAIPGDIDIALGLSRQLNVEERLIQKEKLRGCIARSLDLPTHSIDLVDVRTIGLSLASSIVEEGIVLKGDESLQLARFYSRIWALEEDFYWRLNHENKAISG